MKQEDIATLIIVVFVAGVASFFVSSKFISPSSDKLEAEVVSKITKEFQLPDKKVFNTEAINPTVKIEIGTSTNPDPFVPNEED